MKTMRCIHTQDNLSDCTWIFRRTESFLAFITNPIKRNTVLSPDTVHTLTHIARKQKFWSWLYGGRWEKEKQRARETGEMWR